MNFDYLDYKKRSHILITLNVDALSDIRVIELLCKYVGGLIVNVEDIKEYKEQELIILSKLTYTPVFIQSGRFLYRLKTGLRKALSTGNIKEFIEKMSKTTKADAAIVYSPLVLEYGKHEKLNLPVFLSVKDPLMFDSFFRTNEFAHTCNGFVLNYSDIKDNASIINTLKNYF